MRYQVTSLVGRSNEARIVVVLLRGEVVGELGFERLCGVEAIMLGEEGGAGAGFFPGGVGAELPYEAESTKNNRPSYSRLDSIVNPDQAECGARSTRS